MLENFRLLKEGMGSQYDRGMDRMMNVTVTAVYLGQPLSRPCFYLSDGRTVGVPIDAFPELADPKLTVQQLANFTITDGAVTWPELKLTVSAAQLLSPDPVPLKPRPPEVQKQPEEAHRD